MSVAGIAEKELLATRLAGCLPVVPVHRWIASSSRVLQMVITINSGQTDDDARLDELRAGIVDQPELRGAVSTSLWLQTESP